MVRGKKSWELGPYVTKKQSREERVCYGKGPKRNKRSFKKGWRHWCPKEIFKANGVSERKKIAKKKQNKIDNRVKKEKYREKHGLTDGTFTVTLTNKDKKGKVHTKKVRVQKGVRKWHRHVPITKPAFWSLDEAPSKREAGHSKKYKKKNIARLRKSITPGTVLILLGGVVKGKRCVFLKQLSSGLLLVVGPYKVNKIPLRRVNQAYVIATSMKIDLSKANFWKQLEKVDDDVFIKDRKFRKKRKGKDDDKTDFFEGDEQAKKSKKTKRAPWMRKLTAQIDRGIITEMKKIPHLRRYMTTKFRLQATTYPHLMKF
jgi:large subunit ribosomal protein L6e